MRPKQTTRQNAKGERVFCYLCTAKEKSKGYSCKIPNANGNLLDQKVWAALQKMDLPQALLARALDKFKPSLHRLDGETNDIQIQHKIQQAEQEIRLLTQALGKTADDGAQDYILQIG